MGEFNHELSHSAQILKALLKAQEKNQEEHKKNQREFERSKAEFEEHKELLRVELERLKQLDQLEKM